MANPFRVGDKVYIVQKPGEMKVVDIPNSHSVTVLGKNKGIWELHIKYVSFKPWPEPCHERPIQDGWWIVRYGDVEEPVLRQVKDGRVLLDGESFPMQYYTFHKYVGTDWEQG